MDDWTLEKKLELQEAAYQIRRLSIEMITYARWGHPGGRSRWLRSWQSSISMK